jgi:signal transduction histidine kinase
MSHERRRTPRRILIVDEDGAAARALADRLTRDGYIASVAAHKRHLMPALRETAPDMVLLDARYVDSEAAMVSQLFDAYPTVPWIAMTERADVNGIAGVFRAGARDFFEKSEPFDKLAAILERCFDVIEYRQRSDASYETLLRAKEAAEAANRAKSEFLATMSHELRTPLNAIIGFSEVIMRGVLGPIGNETYQSYIQDIHSSGRHLLDIINDILEFSKAEAGKLDLIESEVEVQEAIVALLRLTGPRARDAGLEIMEHIPADLPRLWCDERKLKQMLLNLLSNAVKFTPSGGRIEVSARCDESGFTITVRDTGVGIAKSNLPRVLQPFVQVENSLGRRYEGTGLGLTLVKSMIELHDGELELESELGKGTTVRLVFPPQRVGSASCADAAVGID